MPAMDRSGRPRDPHIDGAVLDTTVEVLAQVGYAGLTLEAVARRAGTTKPAIYRRWPTRQALVLAALRRRLGGTPRVADSGCVVCDLTGGVGVFLAAFRRMPPGVLAALLADCKGDHRDTFMTQLFEPQREAVSRIVDRARDRGDLRADLDRGLVVDLLASFVHYRALFGHAPTDADDVEAAVTTLLRGMAADHRELAGRKPDHEHQLN